MSNQQKIKTRLVSAKKEVMLVNHPLQPQDLAKTNQMLIRLVLALMAVVFVLSSYLLPAHDMAVEIQEKQLLETTLAEDLKNPVLTAEIENLKGQLVGLVSGSIENKLNSLEKSIKLGSVLGSLETINSLKEDVKVLRTYTNPLEQKKQQAAEVNAVLVKEVSQLKKLIYLTLGSCSLMFVALAGIWIKSRKQLLSRIPDYLEKKG